MAWWGRMCTTRLDAGYVDQKARVGRDWTQDVEDEDDVG